jgi:D-tyrosyl-tRNA(Tyr) deacylase
MRALIQRVSSAEIFVEEKSVARIQNGIIVFLCVIKNDTKIDLDYIVHKVLNTRIFPDNSNRFEYSVKNMNLEILAISQFTLAANTLKGLRPSFYDAADPDDAKNLYEQFLQKLKQYTRVQSGIFGADMQVHSVNTGPVSINLDSRTNE